MMLHDTQRKGRRVINILPSQVKEAQGKWSAGYQEVTPECWRTLQQLHRSSHQPRRCTNFALQLSTKRLCCAPRARLETPQLHRA